MTRRAKRVLAILIVVGWIGHVRGTGYFGPDQYLDRGGENVDASPEFYWELEVKRLSAEFHPPEKRIAGGNAEAIDSASINTAKAEFTAQVDAGDFADAIKTGEVKPVDAQKATAQHQAARTAIGQINGPATSPLAEEFPSEFTDYHRGAFFYRQGADHFAEARQAWESLMKRSETTRHYRTVWAMFMLGKIALKSGDFPGAAKLFQKTRELTTAGFADSLGMAADSYGWEGRAEWKQDHAAAAAKLFLTQLALGDESAIVSLKALVPDREPIEGMLNYGPEPEEISNLDDAGKRNRDQKTLSELKAAAQDPLLRRLVTSHILATASTRDVYADESGTKPVNRCARWLATLNQLKLSRVEDAEYLGWVAYNNGDYKGAARWLELANPQKPVACWLRAKLQRRAGKLADAAKSMAEAWEGVHQRASYTGWQTANEEANEGRQEIEETGGGPHWSFGQSASGDLGALRLSRGDFIQALDTFLKGGLWNDAAFIAERVLTTDELKKYVDQESAGQSSSGKENIDKLRYLLGRRLVREDRYDEAMPYMRAPYDKVLQKYVKALKDGADEKAAKSDRARVLFTAAWLARHDGMELMGTEVAPDSFVEQGDFEVPDLAKQRLTGKYEVVKYENGNERKLSLPIHLRPTSEEVQRLNRNKIVPDKRFHYRLIAGELAIKAAGFLKDNSEELADVINTAGNWVKNRDQKLGDRYFLLLRQRAATTAIGKAAVARHYFVDETGPWSKQEQEAHGAMMKEFGVQTSPPSE